MKKILFITSTRVGDAVLSTGLLHHLTQKHPQAKFTIACGPAAAPLFEAVPRLEKLIVLTKKSYSLHWLGLWNECAFRLWDLVVDLRNAPLNYLIPARSQKRLTGGRQQIHRVPLLAGVLGLEDTPPAPHLWTSQADEEKARDLIPDGSPVLAIGPAANWTAKTWRPENFIALTEKLCAKGGVLEGARIAIFGLEAERAGAKPFIEAVPDDRRIDLMGKVSLSEIAACLKRSSFYIGNDSGLMHMAAASGTPTLGLFGPSKESLYAPWGENCATIRTPLAFNDIHPEGFDHSNTGTLMDGLTVEMAERAAIELWNRL